jgi:hypothetical protein
MCRWPHVRNSEESVLIAYSCKYYITIKFKKLCTNYIKLNKVQSIFKNSKRIIDQYILLLCKGQLGWVQYIPLKRATFGIKIYMFLSTEVDVLSTELDEQWDDASKMLDEEGISSKCL